MAEVKRKTLVFKNNKQIKLYGNSIAIARSLEIGEGYAPNILSASTEVLADKTPAKIINPYGLTQEELHELADYNIQLWMDLKAAVRKHGITNAMLFNQEALR